MAVCIWDQMKKSHLSGGAMSEVPKGSSAAVNLHSASQVLVLKALDTLSDKDNETVALAKLHEMTALMSRLVDVVAKNGGGDYKVLRHGYCRDMHGGGANIK